MRRVRLHDAPSLPTWTLPGDIVFACNGDAVLAVRAAFGLRHIPALNTQRLAPLSCSSPSSWLPRSPCHRVGVLGAALALPTVVETRSYGESRRRTPEGLRRAG